MRIVGVHKTVLRTKDLSAEHCPHCHQQHSLQAVVYGSHFHLLGIPLFPFHKKGQIECSSCGSSWNKYKAPQLLKAYLNMLGRKSNFRFVQYSGIILAFFIYQIKDLPDVEKELNSTTYTPRQDGKAIPQHSSDKHSAHIPILYPTGANTPPVLTYYPGYGYSIAGAPKDSMPQLSLHTH